VEYGERGTKKLGNPGPKFRDPKDETKCAADVDVSFDITTLQVSPRLLLMQLVLHAQATLL
jgi:hypothetical protein